MKDLPQISGLKAQGLHEGIHNRQIMCPFYPTTYDAFHITDVNKTIATF